ncbi:MAG: Crp/Fnr family transcriptional regulator [Spirochaetales bacterium]|nr:MAG: Crp/Fnr family transcriptional regulator [Spirochaetales bacterium]
MQAMISLSSSALCPPLRTQQSQLTMDSMESSTLFFEAGTIIFKEGDKGEVMYVLVKGCVELRKKVEGGETVLKVVKTPNEFFGEMALIDGRPRSATAVCSEKTRLIAVDDAIFDSMVLSNPKFALTIIKTLSARIRSSNVHISELTETIPRERVARGLVDFALRQGEKIFDGGYKVSVQDMREWVNSHLGITHDDFDAMLSRYLKNDTIRYAATSAKTREHIILPGSFIAENNRRDR